MEIQKISLYKAKLPLKKSFKHGSFERHYNNTIFVELKDNNLSGFGESLPRHYVSGETSKDVIKNLKKYVSKMPKKFRNLDEISEFLHDCEPKDSRNMASLCGLDMALLDLYGKSKQKPLSEILIKEENLIPNKNPKITSAPLGLNTKEWKKGFYCLAGINDIKLKITPETDPNKIYRIANKFPKPNSFRLDGNCSFKKDELADLLIGAKTDVDYIEQPFPINTKNPDWENVNFLADESLVSLKDAETIDFDAASIRIGKNGGILRTLETIEEWEKRGKPYMIGSLVGETSLLSSALLHISKVTNPFLNEGCYSKRLLKKDPCSFHPTIGYKGKVKFDYSKPGLGVDLYLFDKDVEKVEVI